MNIQHERVHQQILNILYAWGMGDDLAKTTAEAMVESALQEIAYFQEVDFDLIKISVKASNVPLMVEAYRQLSEVTDYPLHLGVTEAASDVSRWSTGDRLVR